MTLSDDWIPAERVTAAVRDGLQALGIERLVLAIHDQSFPVAEGEDLGRGTPYGLGARALLRFAARLGFDGLQLGPQGDTSLDNPSPYDGALFTRNPTSIALGMLDAGDDPDWRALSAGLLAPLVAGRPPGPSDRAQHAYAWRAGRLVLAQLHARFVVQRAARPALAARFEAFRRTQAAALAADGAFEALAREHATDDWRRWPVLDRDLFAPASGLEDAARRRLAEVCASHVADIERHLFGQFLLAEQHQALRAAAATAGPVPLALFGDFQIGYSHRDVWSRRALFRRDYLMGAPPSRTNPAGQAWGYPVLDPTLYRAADGSDGPALQLLGARLDRMLADFDGIRIDHPHGLVCPWVYDLTDPDPGAAVARGARLFDSPNLPDHPHLATLAIARADELSRDPGIFRYADDWVRALDEPQVARYGVLFDAIMARVAATGRRTSDVVCEVLSTWPYPLRRVMERYGLGRFCVTQKADLARADDVYRSENAGPRDWIMVGNHDTASIWALAHRWHGTATGAERAGYLAARLAPSDDLRAGLAHWLAADARHLCQGMFAELFASRAHRVSVFFADLFGAQDTYNRPGVVSAENWTLRLPTRFGALYRERVGEGAAFNVPLALALACVARREPAQRAAGRALLAAAGALTPGLDAGIVALVETALA